MRRERLGRGEGRIGPAGRAVARRVREERHGQCGPPRRMRGERHGAHVHSSAPMMVRLPTTTVSPLDAELGQKSVPPVPEMRRMAHLR
jgi:hypothetical protein